MEQQNNPLSNKKPENLPNLDVVLKDNTNLVRLKWLHCELWLKKNVELYCAYREDYLQS